MLSQNTPLIWEMNYVNISTRLQITSKNQTTSKHQIPNNKIPNKLQNSKLKNQTKNKYVCEFGI
jgi:hypothetical protein